MDRNEMMQKWAREANEKDIFNGTWLFAENGEIVSKGAVGWRDPDNSLPMKEDCLFDLASVSKNFTATAIMLLRREGLLDLDDEITKFFPEIPYKGVTIRNLLTHTGGLPDYMKWVDQTARKENTIPENDVIVRFLCECGMEPLFAPGEKFEYSNTGFCLLAQIVEKVSGVKFDDFMKKNVFEPAGMTSTALYHRRKDGITIEDLAYGMVPEDGRYVLPDDSKTDNYVVPLDGMSGDGIIHSNIFDLFAWDRALREEKVLTKEEQEMMYTPGKLNNGEMAGEDGAGYGFGWYVVDSPESGRIVYHSGGWPGYVTWFGRYLDKDKDLIFLNCRESTDDRGEGGFFQGMSDIANGEEPKPIKCIEDIEVKDPDKSKWASYCGKYEPVGEYYIEEVFLKDGELFAKCMTMMGFELEAKLYPIGENVFGLKRYDDEIEFRDGCFVCDEVTHRKL